MRAFFGWAGATAIGLAACGGNVILDGNTAPGTSGSGSGGLGNTGGLGPGGSGVGAFGVGGSGGVTVVGVGGVGGCSTTCAVALDSGGMPCFGTAQYTSLRVCAGCNDMGNCEGVCGASLCQAFAVSMDCLSCIQTACSAELLACRNN